MRPRIPALLSVLALLLIAFVAAPAQAASPKPSSVKVAAQYHTGIRVQWAWKSGISSYQVQAATDPSFATIARQQTVRGKSKRPSGAKMAVTVQPLKNATKYSFRVRARSGKTWSSWSSTVNGATRVAWPAKFTSVKGKAGPRAGEITVSWQQSGASTTAFQLETAITRFSKTASSGLPRVGENQRLFTIDPTKRSITLSAAQVADAGAAGGSGIHLMYRLYAINKGTAGQQIRRYAILQAVLPAAPNSVIGGDSAIRLGGVRAGTFNVRSAKATADKRSWLQRRADVAQQIVSERPDVLALQEIGPGRADGQSGSTTGTMRQTTSLLDSLKRIGASRYKMVRTTPYIAAGTTHGSQGTRLLYNSDEVDLLSDCPETTGGANYSTSCALELPTLSGDPETQRRSATYARFRIKASGTQFFMVSVHLDARHSTSTSTEAIYGALRARQVDAVLRAVDKVNTGRLPVLVAGDLNSYQNLTSGDTARGALAGHGYVDNAAAPIRVNLKYSTYNGFGLTQPANGLGIGSRLDAVFAKGAIPQTFENVTKVTDSARPSDHNLVVSNLMLFRN